MLKPGIPHPRAPKLSNSTVDTQNTPTAPPKFHFDELIIGSENKPIHKKVIRNHVISVIEGYNSVVFACGQTASGKVFTLVCLILAPPLSKGAFLEPALVA